VRENVISVTPERILFDGRLGKLKPHSHAAAALLVGVDRTFRLETAAESSAPRVAIVPAAILHELDFHGARVIAGYVEPHDPNYAAIHRGAAGACRTLGRMDDAWRRAVTAWSGRGDSRPLLTLALETFGQCGGRMDARVRRLSAHFSRGELLDAPVSDLAARVGLSASRLVHLLKQELAVGARRLKQHYRFRLAALAAARGESLTTAAHGAGFADSAHFSRSFLETFGLPPSQVFLQGRRRRAGRPLR
jgi:AraC-like DNA-binding protein